MNYSVKVSSESQRASKVLLRNKRLNRKTGNPRKRAGWIKREETVDGRLGNGRRNGLEGNAEQATHDETGNEKDGTEMSGNATGKRTVRAEALSE